MTSDAMLSTAAIELIGGIRSELLESGVIASLVGHRKQDITKVDTLGPFAAALNQILIATNYQRLDSFFRIN